MYQNAVHAHGHGQHYAEPAHAAHYAPARPQHNTDVVLGVPSMTIQGGRVVVGDANSSARDSLCSFSPS